MTSTEALLLNKYGSPLLSLDAVAEILGRSSNGLRVSLSGNNEIACKLRLLCQVDAFKRHSLAAVRI